MRGSLALICLCMCITLGPGHTGGLASRVGNGGKAMFLRNTECRTMPHVERCALQMGVDEEAGTKLETMLGGEPELTRGCQFQVCIRGTRISEPVRSVGENAADLLERSRCGVSCCSDSNDIENGFVSWLPLLSCLLYVCLDDWRLAAFQPMHHSVCNPGTSLPAARPSK